MATSYALPPWLAAPAAPNPASAFISSLGHGVAIGQQAARAAQEYAMQAQRIAAAERKQAQDDEREQAMLEFKQQQLQEESMIQQQKLEVQKSYNEQRNMLRADALKQVEAKMQQAAKVAAAKMAAQRQYSDTMSKIAQLEESGSVSQEEADSARRKTLMQFGPAMGAPLGSLAQLGKPGFKPTIELVKGPDGTMERVLRRSPETVQLLDKKATPARVSVTPFGKTVSGPAEDPAVKAALAEQAAANAPATNAPSEGFLSRLAQMAGFETAPQAAAPVAKPAPAAGAAPAEKSAAQFYYNPKTRKIESVGAPPPPPPPPPDDTTGDQTDLSDLLGDLPDETEGDTTTTDDTEEPEE